MSGEFKTKLKQFVKDLKKFKKLSKKNQTEASKLALVLIDKSKKLSSEKHFDKKEKECSELLRLTEILKLYVQNIKALEKINSGVNK